MVISSIDGRERMRSRPYAPLGQHHPTEGEQVVDRRDEPAGAGLEARAAATRSRPRASSRTTSWPVTMSVP